MANKNYQKGRAHEYTIKHILEENGYRVTRAAGSHSEFDLIALKETSANEYEVWLMQLKCHRVKE